MRDPLDIIEYAESKGKNVPNYKYGPGFTAQGYYQITNPTWRDFAKVAGVDISQYPSAMSAPKDVQRAVAEQIYKKRGFQPWKAVEHLQGQEKDYRVGHGLLAAATSPQARPAVQEAKATTIQQLQKQLLEKYPELQVTSGYRDPAHNRRVGGARNSQHTHGTAIDVSLKGLDEARQREVIEYARSLGARGLGYYPNSQSAHFDVRQGAPAAWGPNYSRTSLPQTPAWYQQIAKQHLEGGGGQVAAAPAADSGLPNVTQLPPAGLIGQTSDPWADMLAEREKAQQAQQLAQVAQAQAAPPPAAPAPPPEPAAPPVDYSALLMPRLRRGLLAEQGYGLLA